jgi:hypothetical protein
MPTARSSAATFIAASDTAFAPRAASSRIGGNAGESLCEALHAPTFLVDADERRDLARRFNFACETPHFGTWSGVACKQYHSAGLQLFNGAQVAIGRHTDGEQLGDFLAGKTHDLRL